MQWFYIRNGQRNGPVEETEFFRLAREGGLAPDDLVWNPAMGQEWKPAATIPNLFATPAAGVPAVPGATPNRELLRQARESLRGRWALAVGATLLYLLVTNGPQFIPYLGGLVILFIAGPILLGWNRLFLSIVRRGTADVGQLFDGFKMFGRTLWAYWLIYFFISLWCLFLFIPAILAAVLIPMVKDKPEGVVLLVILLSPLILLALVPAIRAALSYAQTFYVLSDHPETTAREAIRQSKQMMVGFKWKLFWLPWRFIGWAILCMFTCGIGILWLIPYMTASNAAFYDDLRTR